MADGHFPEVPLLLHYFYFYSFPISNTTKREKVPQLINANSWKFSPCFILSHQCHDHNFHLSVSSFFFMPMQYHLPEVLFSCLFSIATMQWENMLMPFYKFKSHSNATISLSWRFLFLCFPPCQCWWTCIKGMSLLLSNDSLFHWLFFFEVFISFFAYP